MGVTPEGKVVLVTGASRGIGEATARLFASRGWSVALAARSADELERVAAEIEASGGRALAVPTDVTDWNAVDAMVSRTVAHFGRLDAVVNNAGRGAFGAISSVEMERVEEVFRLNVFAPLAIMRASASALRESGGVVVNVSSQAENIALPLLGVYSASKVALSYLSDSARAEFSHSGVGVTNVLPGATATDFQPTILRVGDSGDFLMDQDDMSMQSVPPGVVAEKIWHAVHERPRQLAVSTGEGAAGHVARALPGPTNRILTFALNRYILRTDRSATSSPKRDLALVALAASGVAAAAVALKRTAGR